VVRSALPRDGLSRTPVSAVSETARGMRAPLGPRISAANPCQAGAERKGIPIPQPTLPDGFHTQAPALSM